MSFRSMKFELMDYIPELNNIQAGVRLNRAYQTLLDRHQWSFLKREALFNTLAPYNTGTVNVVLGSTTVTGNGTAWTADMIGRYLKAGSDSQSYLITDLDPIAQSLEIELAYSQASSTQGYSIYQHRYAKPTDCKHVVNIRRNLPLTERTKEWFDGFDPDRDSTGEPIYWANYDDQTVEIYPVPDQAYTLRLGYARSVANLSAETDTSLLPENLVITFAILVAYRQAAAKAEGKQYVPLIEPARKDFLEAWQPAYEADLNKQSLPTQVLQDGVDLPVSSDFWLAHDPFFAGR